MFSKYMERLILIEKNLSLIVAPYLKKFTNKTTVNLGVSKKNEDFGT